MFAPSEYEALAALDAPRRAAAFLRCWTRKEAFVKTTGDGLEWRLDAFEVSFVDPTEPAGLLRVPVPDRPFRMVGLQPAPRSWGALCWEGPERPVEIRSRPLSELIRGRGV